MSSIREQILARVKAALDTAAPGGAIIFRAREVSITRAQVPSIVVMAQNNSISKFSTELDKNLFEFALEIFVRGDPWDQLADPVDVAANAALMGDAQLQALTTEIRRVAEDYEGLEADRTAGTLTVRYRVTYLTRAADISRAP